MFQGSHFQAHVFPDVPDYRYQQSGVKQKSSCLIPVARQPISKFAHNAIPPDPREWDRMLRLLGHPHSRVLDCRWKLTGRPKTEQAFRDWPGGLSLRQRGRGGSPKCRKPLIINKLLAGRSVTLRASGPGRPSPPIWPCTTRGFPCLRCCHRSGGLLPHLFTLAKRAHQKRRAGGFASCLSSRCCGQSAKADSPRFRAGGLFSVALSVARSSRFAFAPHANQPPGVTRRVALRLVALRLRATVSGLSSRFAALRRRNRRSPDLPASFNYTRSLAALMSLKPAGFFTEALSRIAPPIAVWSS